MLSVIWGLRLAFWGCRSLPHHLNCRNSRLHTPPPRVTFRRVVAPLRGPGHSPVLPFACCVGSLRSVGRCGRRSCWCHFRVRGAQYLVCWGCAGCGGMCRLRVSGAQAYGGCAGCCGARLIVLLHNPIAPRTKNGPTRISRW